MSRFLLAFTLLACAGLAAAEPYVYDTVNGLLAFDKFQKQYQTTIQKFVNTEACAVDDSIHSADFSTCNFQFVEDVVRGTKPVSSVSCDRLCAEQFGVVTKACYKQFRFNMQTDKRFGDLAAIFFSKCDRQEKVHTGASVGAASIKPKPDPKPINVGSATDVGSSTAGNTAPGDAATGAGAATTEPTVSATDLEAGSPAGSEEPAAPPSVDETEVPSAYTPDVAPETETETPGANPPAENAPAPPGAEAPTADAAPSPAPGPADTPAPAPGPDMPPAPAPAPISGASATSMGAVALALLGAALLLVTAAAPVPRQWQAEAAASQAGQWRRLAAPSAALATRARRRQAPGCRRGFATEEEASTLAPCELPAVEQQSNELDSQLAAAAGEGAEAVLAIVEHHGERFTEQNVVSALKAIAAAAPGALSPEQVVKHESYQALVDMTLAGLQRFPPPLLAEAVHACGVAGASEEMLLDEVGRHIMRHTEELSPQDITHLAGGYAALDHSPSLVLFEELAARAAALQQQFSAHQKRALADAYETLGYGSKSPFN